MNFLQRLFAGPQAAPQRIEPRAAVQMAGGGVTIDSPEKLEEYLREGSVTKSGVTVTPDSSMRTAAVYACVRIISGSVATLPLQVMRRVDAKIREDASDTGLAKVLRRRPNRWQKPAQFRRMMQAHVLLRGNAYAQIVRSMFGDREVMELIPLHPDRVKTRQLRDLSLEHVYTRPDGGQVVFKQSEILHLFGLTLDGFTGVTPITYARETIGLSRAMEEHGATVFKNGARVSTVLRHPGKLGKEGLEFLRASLDEYRAGGESEGKSLILEEGMTAEKLAMTSEDAQWLEARKFSRSDIFMFFGVPPHMAGDTEKSTSWGTGIEQQTQGFVAFTLEDHLVMWEEGITVDLIPDDSNLYARFNRNALVRGDIKTRWQAYVWGRQWGIYNPDDVRAFEDMNPREDGKGGEYAEPPNTAGQSTDPQKDAPNEPAQTP